MLLKLLKTEIIIIKKERYDDGWLYLFFFFFWLQLQSRSHGYMWETDRRGEPGIPGILHTRQERKKKKRKVAQTSRQMHVVLNSRATDVR